MRRFDVSTVDLRGLVRRRVTAADWQHSIKCRGQFHRRRAISVCPKKPIFFWPILLWSPVFACSPECHSARHPGIGQSNSMPRLAGVDIMRRLGEHRITQCFFEPSSVCCSSPYCPTNPLARFFDGPRTGTSSQVQRTLTLAPALISMDLIYTVLGFEE